MKTQIVGITGGSAAAFADAAGRYWLGVFPQVRREVASWRARAQGIPDPELRRLALENLHLERGNLDGAAAFAAFVPRPHRAEVIRALVAFQATYDYLDSLAEQPSEDPVNNGRRLHSALLVALDARERQPDYYAYHSRSEDGGYLYALVDTCRRAFAALRSHGSVSAAALRAAARIASYQSFNLTDVHGGHGALARWARTEAPSGTGLRWWEVAASAGSSLAVFALIAAAADPALPTAVVAAIERAYFPWIGALHTLLDSLVDLPEDLEAGQRSLLEYYGSSQEAASRMGLLALESVRVTGTLPQPRQHALILAAMSSNYLSAPEASHPDALAASSRVLDALGHLATPSMLVLRVRRRIAASDTRIASIPVATLRP